MFVETSFRAEFIAINFNLHSFYFMLIRSLQLDGQQLIFNINVNPFCGS